MSYNITRDIWTIFTIDILCSITTFDTFPCHGSKQTKQATTVTEDELATLQPCDFPVKSY